MASVSASTSRTRTDLDASRIGLPAARAHQVGCIGGQCIGVDDAERWIEVGGRRPQARNGHDRLSNGCA